MSRYKQLIILSLFLLIWVAFSYADEGMWMPHQMKDLNLEAQGMTMNPNELYKTDGTGVMNAVVHIGSGGTGSFVSSEGLVFTNHHVAFGAVQRASDEKHDYITNGFLAQQKNQEIIAPGYYIDVLLGYEDVTSLVMQKYNKYTGSEKKAKALELLEKKLVAKTETEGKDIYCVFKSMYSGNKYYLFKYKRLLDIRIVYAPPRSIGNFGGEIDNWMWPRHTGDFSFLRAYVSKDNLGVPYNENNVPYQPKSYLKVSLDGVKEGDFTFSMGYPVKTIRNITLSELNLEIKKMVLKVNVLKEMVLFLEKESEKNQGIRIKYAARLKGFHNGLKNREAKLLGIQKKAVLEKKSKFEAELMQWDKEHPDAHADFANNLEKIETFITQNETFYLKKQLMEDLVDERIGPTLFTQAYLIYRTSVERQKPLTQRDSNFQENDIPGIKTKIEVADRGFEINVDKALFKLIANHMLTWDKNYWPKAFKPILEKGPEAIDSYVEQLYNTTILTDTKKRVELINMKPRELRALNEPMLQLAADFLTEIYNQKNQSNEKGLQLDGLKKAYLAGLLSKHEGKLAPDANATIRFTYGPVKRYYPSDGVTFLSQTTLTGIMEKETGSIPFQVPEKLKKLYKERDFGRYIDKHLNDIATCFINTTNVTGGSSGSPVMNGAGEIVGISFDMVYESVIGDFFIIPEIQRVINADIRYAMFITDKFSGADILIKELGL